MSQNGPELWDKLLEAVGNPEAVLAGGAIRDYCLGVAPKDYDLFVGGDRGDLIACCDRLESAGLGIMRMLAWGGGYGSYDDPLVAVAEGHILGHCANIIVNDRMKVGPDHLVEGFDFAIAQGWYRTGMDTPRLTQGAMKDIADKTATLVTMRTYTRSYKRIDKYNIRNGNLLRLVDPFQGSFTFT